MAKHEDPEGIELQTTLRHASFEGKDVLEVGCGDGRLTFKYAGMARRVVAIDPNAEQIERAKRNVPKELVSKLEFRVGEGEKLPFPQESYDVVFFTWSLCCISVPFMKKALQEAWRVLKPNGTLINLQPSLQQPFLRGIIKYFVTKKFDILGDGTQEQEEHRQARHALKYVSLVEGKFGPTAEEELTVNTYYDTVEEALEDIIQDKREAYSRLDQESKREILERLKSMTTNMGVQTKENATLTILRKSAGLKQESIIK